MDWVLSVATFVLLALLVWTDFRLARRIEILEKVDKFTDDALFSLAEQVIQLQIDLASVTAPKTRAVKKPTAS
jgi:hypothetical protein